MKKTITIKNALTDDKEYLDNLQTSMKVSASEVLTHVINQAKTAQTPQETAKTEAETSKLKETVLSLTTDNTRLLGELSEANTEKEALLKQVEETEAENITVNKTVKEQAERIAELEADLEKINSNPKAVTLEGSQFVCELTDENATNVRKIRKYAKKEGIVSPDCEGVAYANEYVNAAVIAFNKRHFSDII